MQEGAFIRMISSPTCGRAELVRVLRNLRGRNRPDCEALVRAELDRRFPGYSTTLSKRSGSRPNVANFRGETETFPNAKEGFLWLVERMLRAFSPIIESTRDGFDYVVRGKRRWYLAKSPTELFPGAPHLAEHTVNYARLSNGLFVITNLSNTEKMNALLRLSAVADLEYGRDWSWDILGATESLVNLQRRVKESQDILRQISQGA